MHVCYWWESQKEREHWEDQDVGGILERWGGMYWIGVAHDSNQWSVGVEHGHQSRNTTAGLEPVVSYSPRYPPASFSLRHGNREQWHLNSNRQKCI
jgi:hypothetical protein